MWTLGGFWKSIIFPDKPVSNWFFKKIFVFTLSRIKFFFWMVLNHQARPYFNKQKEVNTHRFSKKKNSSSFNNWRFSFTMKSIERISVWFNFILTLMYISCKINFNIYLFLHLHEVKIKKYITQQVSRHVQDKRQPLILVTTFVISLTFVLFLDCRTDFVYFLWWDFLGAERSFKWVILLWCRCVTKLSGWGVSVASDCLFYLEALSRCDRKYGQWKSFIFF